MKATGISPKSTAAASASAPAAGGGLAAKRQPYNAPRITAHGPMSQIALGGSPGAGDSGPGVNVQNPRI
jgi:hypothetical protein